MQEEEALPAWKTDKWRTRDEFPRELRKKRGGVGIEEQVERGMLEEGSGVMHRG